MTTHPLIKLALTGAALLALSATSAAAALAPDRTAGMSAEAPVSQSVAPDEIKTARARLRIYIYSGPRRPYYRSRRHLRPRIRVYRPRVRRSRCSHWRRECGYSWGYGNRDYRGCLRYHGCR